MYYKLESLEEKAYLAFRSEVVLNRIMTGVPEKPLLS